MVTAALLVVACALALGYASRRRHATPGVYSPRLAWLRAGLYFCACLLAAEAAGVLDGVLGSPLATDAQRADPRWWLLVSACFAVVIAGYAFIWPRGTFTDGRTRHSALSLLYGATWGACQGLWFLALWSLVGRSGLAPIWIAVISYLLIGTYNGVWHRFFWDIQVSPPHNYREWNGRKVLLCHTPNLLLGLSLLALYGNAGLFVGMQVIALAASAWHMRFPAWWDDYSATPGEERSLVTTTPARPD